MKKSYTLVLLFIVFIAYRLYFLFTFPPFTDESLYIRWGQLMIYNPNFRWASLTFVSRQPLAMWLFGIGSFIFHHPLYGARLMVFLVNIPVFFILSDVMKRSYPERVRHIALALLAVSPLFILTQTLALMDGLLFAVSCYTLWLILQPWKKKIPVQIPVIAVFLGIALWIKTTAFLIVLLATLGLLWKRLRGDISTTQVTIGIAMWCLGPALIILPLVLQPNFSNILHEPDFFVFTAKELFQFPVAVWFRNFLVTPVVLLLYLNPLIIFLAYPIRFPKLKDRTVLFMIWLFIPIAITIFIGKNILARYYIIGMIGILPLLAVMTAIFFNRVKWKFAPVVAFCLFSIWGLFFIVNPAGYFHLFPNAVHEQNYAISWTSGYGIPELVSWIDTHVPHDKILLLAVADSPGNPSDYLLTYYYFKPYVRIIFATMTNIHDFRKLEPITEKGSLYLATRLSLITPETQPYLTPIIIFNKPYNEDAIGLYQISFTASH